MNIMGMEKINTYPWFWSSQKFGLDNSAFIVINQLAPGKPSQSCRLQPTIDMGFRCFWDCVSFCCSHFSMQAVSLTQASPSNSLPSWRLSLLQRRSTIAWEQFLAEHVYTYQHSSHFSQSARWWTEQSKQSGLAYLCFRLLNWLLSKQ